MEIRESIYNVIQYIDADRMNLEIEYDRIGNCAVSVENCKARQRIREQIKSIQIAKKLLCKNYESISIIN